MKVVLDTNIFISGIHWSGASGKVLDAWFDEKFVIVTSEPILDELAKTLADFKIPLTDHEILHWISLISSKSDLVFPSRRIKIVSDPDDDKFIEAAVEAGAHYIVSQDKHLLKLKEFEGIKIIGPGEFLRLC